MSFRITKDFLSYTEDNRVKTTIVDWKTPPKVDMPFRFRLYDDDNVLYFEGISSSNDDDAAFYPLEWARDNYGATRIDYYNPTTKVWESL